jgi:L-serine dehydratase
MGPMTAAADFIQLVGRQAARLQVTLFGSLALTGRGHATDVAIIAGLAGHRPESVDPDEIAVTTARVLSQQEIARPDGGAIRFDGSTDIIWRPLERLNTHSNGLRFMAWDRADRLIAERTCYSIGGGAVVYDDDSYKVESAKMPLKRPFTSARELLDMAAIAGGSIADIQRRHELRLMSPKCFSARAQEVVDAMTLCIERGLRQTGVLPGSLGVKRRAHSIYARLRESDAADEGARPLDWVKLWAMAVNEENASGGRVVTAPTNGAAGIIPAVIHYYLGFVEGANVRGLEDFLLTAGAVGALFKENASISGAEVGCQGEVGVACSMAAAGLAAVLGGTALQVENAAEIGMEHNLGLTCDPVGGLVQIPCIERNAMGAVKAIEAARLAMLGDGTHHVTLDQVISTMLQTGRDMSEKYKETSLGGLAANIVEC